MAITHIHTYLVHPGKGSKVPPQIRGNKVPLSGKLFDLLENVYLKSEAECNIDISFNGGNDGKQQNSFRDSVVNYLRKPGLDTGRRIAEKLETVTTHRSGLGLLFLIAGKESRDHKIVISRFPADNAILAEEDHQTLNVEFLERVFMKSAKAYKAAAYRHASFATGFWVGRAVDKQVNTGEDHLSQYWIADFLESNLYTTPAAGTRRLALALKEAAKKADDASVKHEIASAVTLATNLGSYMTSIQEVGNRFNLSQEAREAIAREVSDSQLLREKFRFEPAEFAKHVAYRTVELDTGGMLTAQVADFDTVFNPKLIDSGKQTMRFSAEGKVVSEKFRKTR